MSKSLKDYLTQRILENLPKYKGNRRRDRLELHATTLLDLCPRCIVYCYYAKLPFEAEKTYSLKTYLTFRIGDKIEKIASELLQGIKPMPMGVKINDLYIIGSPDILVDGKYLIECKSIKTSVFESLREPIPKHVAQLSFYLYLAKRLDVGYSTEGAIIYFPKEEASEVVKVFPITLSQAYEKRFEYLIQAIQKGIKEKVLPPRICSSPRKDCRAVQFCFGGAK